MELVQTAFHRFAQGRTKRLLLELADSADPKKLKSSQRHHEGKARADPAGNPPSPRDRRIREDTVASTGTRSEPSKITGLAPRGPAELRFRSYHGRFHRHSGAATAPPAPSGRAGLAIGGFRRRVFETRDARHPTLQAKDAPQTPVELPGPSAGGEGTANLITCKSSGDSGFGGTRSIRHELISLPVDSPNSAGAGRIVPDLLA